MTGCGKVGPLEGFSLHGIAVEESSGSFSRGIVVGNMAEEGYALQGPKLGTATLRGFPMVSLSLSLLFLDLPLHLSIRLVLYHTNDVQAVQAFETVGVENAKER